MQVGFDPRSNTVSCTVNCKKMLNKNATSRSTNNYSSSTCQTSSNSLTSFPNMDKFKTLKSLIAVL